jgi:hypothetical protein
VMMAVIILGIITPGLVMLMSSLTKGFTGYEAAVNLREVNQKSLNKIYLRLGSNKRLFENNANDIGYLNKISLAGNPSLMAGSLLPTIQDAGTLTTGTTNFIPANVGNSLFFANNDSSLQVLNSTQAIVTTTNTVRVDLFRFNYYYLTVNPKPIYDSTCYQLVEWRSVQYADYNQLMNITNTTRRANAIKALYNANIRYAWDTDDFNASSAFYTFTLANGTMSVSAAHILPQYKCTVLTNIITGIVIGGYRYGISANSAGWATAPKSVPIYATAAGAFPGGFEVAIVGSSSGREILLRSVLVAQGTMRGIAADDMQVIASARDLW